jgi:TrmH family RNA methyltransferase
MTLPASTLKLLRSLSQKRERASSGLLLAEGARCVQEALEAGAAIQAAFYTDEVRESAAEFVRRLESAAGQAAQISAKDLQRVSDVVTSQGVLALVRWTPVGPETVLAGTASDALLVACDGLSDPGNMGSLLRTCAWFGVQGVVCGAGCVDVTNPKVVRGSMGAIFHLRIAQEVDLPAVLREAKAAGYQLLGTDASARTRYDSADFGRRTIVVLGNEAHGLSAPVRAAVQQVIRIPRYGKAESLNVAVACGIVLAAARSRSTGGG